MYSSFLIEWPPQQVIKLGSESGRITLALRKMSKVASADTKEIPTDFMNRNEDVLNKIKNAIEFMKIDYNENSDSDCSSSSCSSSSDDD